MALLDVSGLNTRFDTPEGEVKAVSDVTFSVAEGETIGVVGESGSGKSQVFLTILGLLAANGRATGSARYRRTELLGMRSEELNRIRGSRIAMIFQDSMTSLNPYLRISRQMTEVLVTHRGMSEAEARAAAIALLERVRIPEAARRFDMYPHEFSGGMRQRVMIATALACGPKLLIADEPTTALDVTIQAQILKLMLELKERTGAAVILITHNLGIVAETCRRVIVMYAGRKIEEAPILELFDRPAHPYTRGLMASIPRFRGAARPPRLAEIAGIVPSLREPIEGCAFAPRCAHAVARCRIETPLLRQIGEGHVVACHEAERVLAEKALA